MSLKGRVWMLSSDAFLRRLPHALALEQRLELDGILTSADLSSLAFERLTEALGIISSREFGNLELRQTLDLALNCWAIVDNLHNFSQFARRLPVKPDSELKKFLAELEQISALRNAVDHRSSNLKNSAHMRVRAHPIYGFVSFYTALEADQSWDVHQIPLGAMQHKDHVFPAILGGLQAIPGSISQIHLTAFGLEVELSAIMAQLDEGLLAINDLVEELAIPAIRAAAREAGEDEEKALGQIAGAIRLAFRMQSVADAESADAGGLAPTNRNPD